MVLLHLLQAGGGPLLDGEGRAKGAASASSWSLGGGRRLPHFLTSRTGSRQGFGKAARGRRSDATKTPGVAPSHPRRGAVLARLSRNFPGSGRRPGAICGYGQTL